MAGDVTLTAYYVSEEEPTVEAQPVITIDPLSSTIEKGVYKVFGSVTRSIPEGYTLVEHGVLYAKAFLSPTTDNFVYGGTGVSKYVASTTGMNGVVRLYVKADSETQNVTFRGYMILRDNRTGNETVYYTNLATGSYNTPNA